MQQGEEAIAAKEMVGARFHFFVIGDLTYVSIAPQDHLRQLREQGLEATKGQPFPDGTDLHSTSPSGQQTRI